MCVSKTVDGEFYQATCYVRGTSLAATYEYVDAVKSEYTYYLQNAHGDVVNLTDDDGAVTKTYKYDAFGVEKNISDTDTNAFRYCGEYYDSETGTIYLRARYYNPSTGRFTQRDSFAGSLGVPLSLNLYTYCHNNPILYFDPSGHGIGDFYVNIYSYWESGIKDMQSRGMAFKCAASWAKGNMDAIGSKVVGVVDGVSNFVKDPFDTITSAGMNATISMLRPDIKIQQQMQRIKETSLLEELFYISGQTNAQIAEIGIAYTGGEALSILRNGVATKAATTQTATANWSNPDGTIKWPPNDGFDGIPVKETLQPGTVVDRYGYPGGSYASPVGTPYNARSLAPGTELKPYNIYEVLKPVDVNSGVAVPWFGQPGGGIQYKFDVTIQTMIDDSVLRRIGGQ